VADRLDPYWERVARGVMDRLPLELRTSWRARQESSARGVAGRALHKALQRWGALEVDENALRSLRARVAAEVDLDGELDAPAFRGAVAESLWTLGLDEEAARWNPSGFPGTKANEVLWSAGVFLDLGIASRAIVGADAAWRMSAPRIAVRLLPLPVREAFYPLPWPAEVVEVADRADVSWSLLAGLAREESRWKAKAVSSVGARGLTQMMPATAVRVASRLGRPDADSPDLFDPATALELGAAELGRLLEAFDGRPAPALAAYNAGEAQARLWLRECGADCSEERFVMTIAFTATRNYVADVLASSCAYEDLYGSSGAESPSDNATDETGSLPDVPSPPPASARSLR